MILKLPFKPCTCNNCINMLLFITIYKIIYLVGQVKFLILKRAALRLDYFTHLCLFGWKFNLVEPLKLSSQMTPKSCSSDIHFK